MKKSDTLLIYYSLIMDAIDLQINLRKAEELTIFDRPDLAVKFGEISTEFEEVFLEKLSELLEEYLHDDQDLISNNTNE